MLARRSLRRILLASLFLLPFALHAQFRDPSPDELKMTSDPKAPGAAAVYLNLEDSTDDSMHFRSIYARIKILEEKGKELATVELPHWNRVYQVTNLKARTIHSDGTIIPLTGKPEDLLVMKSGTDMLSKLIFTLPQAEVGSILEYRFDLSYGDHISWSPHWEIQRDYFIHHARFSFTPFAEFLIGWKNSMNRVMLDRHGNAVNSVIWWPVLPPGVDVKTDNMNRFSLEISDVPPAPREPWMPPDSSYLYHVNFYYKSAFNGVEYWMKEAGFWSKEVDRLAESTKPLEEAAHAIAPPADSEMDRAKKLYAAVQAMDNTHFSRVKNAAELKQAHIHEHLDETHLKPAAETLEQKSGSRNEIALLYLAMARAASLKASAIIVANRERALFSPTYLEFNQLDDLLVEVTIDGKPVTLDPGEKMCPFGMVAWPHTGTGGIRQGDEQLGPSTTPLQPYSANTLHRIGDLTLDAQGNAHGSFRFVMAGQRALYWRQYALRNDEEEMKRKFNHWLNSLVPNGIQARVDRFQAVDDPTQNLVAQVHFNGPLASVTAKRMLAPAFLFEADAHPFLNQPNRKTPVDMHYAEQVVDQVVFHLPAGYTVESAPSRADLPWQDAAAGATPRAVLATRVVPGQGQVTLARQFVRGFAMLKAEDYQGFLDFEKKAIASDQQQLVLSAPQQ